MCTLSVYIALMIIVNAKIFSVIIFLIAHEWGQEMGFGRRSGMKLLIFAMYHFTGPAKIWMSLYLR